MAIREEKGTILLFTYVLLAALVIAVTSFSGRSISESRLAERQRMSIQAFNLAEAGFERAMFELKQDFINAQGTASWDDGDINGITCTSSNSNFYVLLNAVSFGNGEYSIQLKNIAGVSDEIWVRAKGTVGTIEEWVESYVKIFEVSMWDSAIFAKNGQSGFVINGNVDIRGSVHILGDGLNPTDDAIYFSGSGKIGNNYDGMNAQEEAAQPIRNKLPPLPTVLFNGEMVETLFAELRVKRGQVNLDSNAATVGSPDVAGNGFKETLDGVYVTDGYDGSHGASSVYSDNGPNTPYDMGFVVGFPSLSDPYTDPNSGISYASYQAYLHANSYVVTNAAELNQLANIMPDSNFCIGDCVTNINYISMDGVGNMIVSGLIYIEDSDGNATTNGDLIMKKDVNNNKTITYTGIGSLLVEGDVSINTDLITAGPNSFPNNNIIGIMTPENISIGAPGASHLDVMGVFYADDTVGDPNVPRGTISFSFQTEVYGALVAHYFDLGNQVPAIYYVPTLALNLPPSFIGGNPERFMKVIYWKRL